MKSILNKNNIEMEKILENEKEFLEEQYPIVNFKGEKVKFDPLLHQLEKGESICFLNTETNQIEKGIITNIQFSRPWNYPIYYIGEISIMYKRAWPDINAIKKNKAAKQKALRKLTERDKIVLGLLK